MQHSAFQSKQYKRFYNSNNQKQAQGIERKSMDTVTLPCSHHCLRISIWSHIQGAVTKYDMTSAEHAGIQTRNKQQASADHYTQVGLEREYT